MTREFVLTGTAPAAKEFLIQIVMAVISGDPHLSDKMIDGTCAAIRDLPAFSALERRSILIQQIEKLALAGLYRGRLSDLGGFTANRLADALAEALRAAAALNAHRAAGPQRGPWHERVF